MASRVARIRKEASKVKNEQTHKFTPSPFAYKGTNTKTKGIQVKWAMVV